MSVRRLHPVQPEGFAFTADNLAWTKKIVGNYPAGKQASAVIPVLWRAQEQNEGWVSRPAMEYVGKLLDMAYIRVYEIATFYTMFQLSPVGRRAHIQVCGTTPCMLRGAEDLKKVCQRKIHGEPRHLSADGDFSWEEVECLGACVNAPMIQIWSDTYEDLDPAALESIIDDLAAGKPVRPGPQNGRQFSAPEGGPTTLTDPSLYNGGHAAAPSETVAEPVPVAMPETAPPPLVPEPVKRTAPSAPVAKPPPEKPAKPVASRAPERIVGQPELLKKPRGGKGDDLKLIWGVGPKLEALLHATGIWHFDQVASWTARELAWVDARLEGFKGRAKRDKWIAQARKLAKGWRPANSVGERPK